MRLIDADYLENVITEDWFLEILATKEGKSELKKAIVNCIDSVPLAFSIENFIEEISRRDTTDGTVKVFSGKEIIEIIKMFIET